MDKYSDRIDKLERKQTNVSVVSGTCWNMEQISKVVNEYNTHNELIKMELTIEASDKKAHNYIIWYYKEDWLEP